MSVANKLIGKTLSNRYEILRPLGEGGMGKVYLAKDKRFGKQVVVKMPTMEAGDKDFKDRFMREIASLATLEHPHIVTTVDWGEIEGIPFLVLRYLGGGSLRDRITDTQGFYKPMPLEGLSQWLPQIASALDFIHTKNWVHRDLKPDNILFDETGNPYLADFGIAKALEGAPMGVKTIMGAFIGTPQYMAPEMHLGKGIGPRADQFGLAVLVYEALAGKIPFSGITPTAIFVEVIQGKATPIHELVLGIPLEKSNALMKGITKEPKDRYGSCVEFANAVIGSMLARGSFLVSNEKPSKPEIAGTRIETPLPIPLADPVSTPLEILGTRIETPLPIPLAIPVSIPLENSGTRIETPSKPEITGTRIETPLPIPFAIPVSIPLKNPGTRIETPSMPEIEGTKIETLPIPLEITDSIIEEVPEHAKNTEETEMQSDPEEFNYYSNLHRDLALTSEDYLTESGQLLAQLCRDLVEARKLTKDFFLEARKFLKSNDVTEILGGSLLAEKIESIVKRDHVSKEISEEIVSLARDILGLGTIVIAGTGMDAPSKPELAGTKFERSGSNVSEEFVFLNKITMSIGVIAILALIVTGIIGISISHDNPEIQNNKVVKNNEKVHYPNLKQEDVVKILELIETELILIPAGKFLMGSPKSEPGRDSGEILHEVTISNLFYLGKYEVTQEQWQAVMGINPTTSTIGAKLPVTNVSWDDCQLFIKKLNEKTKSEYRLPTEAEWEFTCRAGTSTAYSYGVSITANDANYNSLTTKEVGSYKPNAFGLYDMHGNVNEWCVDKIAEYQSSAVTDPMGPETGTSRLLRGGSFINRMEINLRSAYRRESLPDVRIHFIGFRLAKTLSPADFLKPDVKLVLLNQEEKNKEKLVEMERLKQEEEMKSKQIEMEKFKQENEVKLANIEKSMVLILPGRFKLGSPLSEKGRSIFETEHEVSLTKPFYMGKYEVTQDQWELVMGDNPSKRTKGPKLPVTNVSWEDCQLFLKKLNEKTKSDYRLPTEAEWEYACRGETKTAYSHGNSITKNDANYNGSIKPVGNYKPNKFGLYDMHGNVWEWCNDFYESYTTAEAIDPKGPVTGTNRVLRGGSFLFLESESRSANRLNFLSTERINDCGFRLAMTK
jgi:formylglycine-generating enzyme required for sulfatase activity/serine/threonine protein kinase